MKGALNAPPNTEAFEYETSRQAIVNTVNMSQYVEMTDTMAMNHGAALMSPSPRKKKEQIIEFEFQVTGMSCVNCSNNIERKMRGAFEDKEMESIDIILLVGGSTRIPRVHQWLRDYFDDEDGEKMSSDVNPDEAVAEGATIMAGMLADQITAADDDDTENENKGGFVKPIVSDVSPLSVGIELAGNKVSQLIKAHSTIPCEATKVYVTSQEN